MVIQNFIHISYSANFSNYHVIKYFIDVLSFSLSYFYNVPLPMNGRKGISFGANVLMGDFDGYKILRSPE